MSALKFFRRQVDGSPSQLARHVLAFDEAEDVVPGVVRVLKIEVVGYPQIHWFWTSPDKSPWHLWEKPKIHWFWAKKTSSVSLPFGYPSFFFQQPHHVPLFLGPRATPFHSWLVVFPNPSEKSWTESQLGWWNSQDIPMIFPIWWESHSKFHGSSHHQPAFYILLCCTHGSYGWTLPRPSVCLMKSTTAWTVHRSTMAL